MGLMAWLSERDNSRSLKKVKVYADKVNALEDTYRALSDAQLQAVTPELKARYAEGYTLDQLLPEAFAAIREACRRVLNMRPFDVQILGGIVLHQGRIAEMRTGEGKTLVAVLPCYLNALTGDGVHVVTVNDYLAKFQAEWMGKVYRFMGLSVGISIPGMQSQAKQEAYACDITYCTNTELGFDYLRDNMAHTKEQRVLRSLKYAIVDEVDSILIDEARTPLIISGRAAKSSQMYEFACKFARALKAGSKEDVEEQEKTDRISSVDMYHVDVDEKKKTAHLTQGGIAKAEKWFSVNNLSDDDNLELNHYINNAIRAQFIMKRDRDYVVEDGEVIIVDEFTGRKMVGRRYSDGLHQAIEAKENVKLQNENRTVATITYQNFFRLYTKLSGMTGTAKTEEKEFNAIYNLDVVIIPTNKPMIRYDENDKIFASADAKMRALVEEIQDCYERRHPVLVGTVSVEKSEEVSDALRRARVPHEVLNAKNHMREADIIAQAGRLGAVTIATNMAGRGTDILLGGNAEYMAKKRLRELGYSEELVAAATGFLATEMPEELEARAKYKELFDGYAAEVEAEKQEVIGLGGLRIVGTERHESRRIDNQLRGRAGRQGDPGSSVFYLSCEDDLVRRFGGDRMKSIMQTLKVDEDIPLEMGMLTRMIENAQLRVEGQNFDQRKSVLQYDDVMNTQRTIIYAQRNKVLDGESVRDEIINMFESAIAKVVDEYADVQTDPDSWDIDGFNAAIRRNLLPGDPTFLTAKRLETWPIDEIKENLKAAMLAYYDGLRDKFTELNLDFSRVERNVLLDHVDRNWMDHIDAMDSLRSGIGLRGYGGHNPVIVYKSEGFEMFDHMIDNIREQVVRVMMSIGIKTEIDADGNTVVKLVLTKQGAGAQAPAPAAKKDAKVGRNDPCPCGSGKKYKHCCGQE
ncbi:MAG: preprotein translocase subunit SecA [Clostridiales bacterium]|jgi:preprotein translocase subunit SecA|nr:preprotein translocase subunit SecA [Clostridiales bacterium]